eukprot:Rmarinus@m.4761
MIRVLVFLLTVHLGRIQCNTSSNIDYDHLSTALEPIFAFAQQGDAANAWNAAQDLMAMSGTPLELLGYLAVMQIKVFKLEDRYKTGKVAVDKFGYGSGGVWLSMAAIEEELGLPSDAKHSYENAIRLGEYSSLWNLYGLDRGLALSVAEELYDVAGADDRYVDAYCVMLAREGRGTDIIPLFSTYLFSLGKENVYRMMQTYREVSRWEELTFASAVGFFRPGRVTQLHMLISLFMGAAHCDEVPLTQQEFFSALEVARPLPFALSEWPATFEDTSPMSLLSTVEVSLRANRTSPHEGGVVFLCPPVLPEPMGPSSLHKGTPGSQEAVVYLSRELSGLGLSVTVYAAAASLSDYGREDASGVVWKDVWGFDPFVKRHVVVCWISPEYCHLALGADTRILWLHSKPPSTRIPTALTEMLTRVLILCEEELVMAPTHIQEKAMITRNGISPDLFVDGPNDAHSFIYASSPDRGLETVLREWHVLRGAIPNAQLHVYYGFTQTFHKLYGSGFWLYPTHFNESSCMTAMKAQANGAIPITSKYRPVCLLSDTNATFDLGPPPSSNLSSATWTQSWTDAVVQAYQDDIAGRLRTHRCSMKTWSRTTLTWQNVAVHWVSWVLPPSVFLEEAG